jgi:hypothetical protein
MPPASRRRGWRSCIARVAAALLFATFLDVDRTGSAVGFVAMQHAIGGSGRASDERWTLAGGGRLCDLRASDAGAPPLAF